MIKYTLFLRNASIRTMYDRFGPYSKNFGMVSLLPKRSYMSKSGKQKHWNLNKCNLEGGNPFLFKYHFSP